MGGRQQRTEKNSHARSDQTLLDRIAHQENAAERKRKATDPDHPAGAEILFKALARGGRRRRCQLRDGRRLWRRTRLRA